MDQFRRRVEMIFKDFQVFGYTESREGPDPSIDWVTDRRPWLEFSLRPAQKNCLYSSCYASYSSLKKLTKLLGTEDILLTGFDYNVDTDNVMYVVARGVSFQRTKAR